MKRKLSNLYKKTINNSLFKQAGAYTAFNLLEKIIPFLILPIIARYLNKEALGYYIVYQAIIAFILPILSLNADAAVLVNYFKLDKKEFAKYFFNSFYIIGITLIIFSIIFTIFPNFLATYLEFPPEWLIALIFIALCTLFVRLIQHLWQIEKQPAKYGKFSISLMLLKDGLMLAFVLFTDLQFDGIVLSQIITYGIFFAITLLILHKRGLLIRSYHKDYIKDSIKVGLPLTFHQIFAWLGNQANRLIINIMVGTAATASFGVGSIYGSIVTVFQNSFNKAYVPHLFDKLKELSDARKANLVKITYYYNLGLLLFALIVGVVGYYFNEIFFSSGYTDSKQFIIYLALGSGFNGLYKMHVNYIFFTKDTKFVMYVTLVAGLANLGLCYLLISLFGVIGAAQAYLISQIISYILAWYFGNKLIPMPWFKKLKQ